MKNITITCILFALLLGLSACRGTGTIVQGISNPDGSTFTISEIQEDPASYTGIITLIGIVGDASTRDFALQNEDGTFEVFVDYRGSQALPQLGEKITVTGTLGENRPCCGPGFTITSTQFEVVE